MVASKLLYCPSIDHASIQSAHSERKKRVTALAEVAQNGDDVSQMVLGWKNGARVDLQ
ncbi:hypothetical protein PIB30_034843 [Stylosanthes scabra]|uniref:Uncharacterized protein n=1 Tax=Stylosanthes scabra TaxID=79078 RepID=A0ABU6XDR7_9FABA|nr:hypothetical protein [Stylosanthes scabra]